MSNSFTPSNTRIPVDYTMQHSIMETQTVVQTVTKIASMTMDVVHITHSFETVTWVEQLVTHTVSIVFKQTEMATQKMVVLYQTIGVPMYFTTHVLVPLYIGTNADTEHINSTMLIGLTAGATAAIAVLVMIAIMLIRKGREVSSFYSDCSSGDVDWESDQFVTGSPEDAVGHVVVDVDLGPTHNLWSSDDDWFQK